MRKIHINLQLPYRSRLFPRSYPRPKLWGLRVFLYSWYCGFHTDRVRTMRGVFFTGWNFRIITPVLMFDIRRRYQEQNTLEVVDSTSIARVCQLWGSVKPGSIIYKDVYRHRRVLGSQLDD